MTESAPDQRQCLNCGIELQGTYCHRCGQKAQNRRLPLKALLHDVLHDLWHVDHKILESLWLLVRYPGFLAEEYLAGRRVRHVPPFRLYVISSFALFLAFSFIPVGGTHKRAKGAAQVTTSVEDEKDAKEGTSADPKPAKAEGANWESSLEARVKAAQKDPERFYRTFLSNLSKSLFLLMPLFAGILLLLHLRRCQTLFVDHMVVSLHHHVVSFLAILLLMGLSALPLKGWGCVKGLVGTLIFFLPPLHLAATLQHLYRRGWLRSLAKTAIVSLIYGLIVSAVLVGLLWLSLPKAG